VARTNGRFILYAPESLRINPLDVQGGRSLSFTEALDGIESVRRNRFGTTRQILAFGFSADLFAPRLGAERRQPQVTVGQMLAVDVQPGVVKYQATFQYEILYSGVRSLRIDVPEAIAADLRNLSTVFQESVMEPAPDDLDEGYLAWKLQADRELLGAVQLQLSWEQPVNNLLDGKSEKLTIAHLRPRDVQRAWGQVVFSKGENIDVNQVGTPTGLRPIDPRIDLMPNTPAQLKLNAARAFEFHQDWTLEVAATRYQPKELETTVVQKAVFRMVLTLSGEQSVQALYRLRSAEQRLPMKLPGNAQLISMRINGVIVTPEQGEGEEVLVPLKSIAADQEFILEVVYRDPEPDNSYLQIPVFTDNPAVHEAHLCAFLPRRQSLVNYGGPWTDNFNVGPWEIYNGDIHSHRNHQDLVDQLAEGLMSPEELDFDLQGVEYVFSTLQPDPTEGGRLRLTTMPRSWLHGLLYLVVVMIGTAGLRVNIKNQVLLVGGMLGLVLLVGVFIPVLYLQLMDGYFALVAMLVIGVWIVTDVVRSLQAASSALSLRQLFTRRTKQPVATEQAEADQPESSEPPAADPAAIADDDPVPVAVAEEEPADQQGSFFAPTEDNESDQESSEDTSEESSEDSEGEADGDLKLQADETEESAEESVEDQEEGTDEDA